MQSGVATSFIVPPLPEPEEQRRHRGRYEAGLAPWSLAPETLILPPCPSPEWKEGCNRQMEIYQPAPSVLQDRLAPMKLTAIWILN